MSTSTPPEAVVRRIEQSTGRLATASVARMDDELPWFRALPAEQRSWVTLVAQAGIAAFVEWMRSPDDILRLTGEVFAAAPRGMVRSVSLLRTVELVRQTITVTEEQIPTLVDDAATQAEIRQQLLRFSREIAFAAARVYALAAESRGAWDDRLEALVIDGLVRGSSVDDDPLSQLAALGWRSEGPVTAMVGSAPHRDPQEILADAHRRARRLGRDAIVGVHGSRLVLLLGGSDDPAAAAPGLLDLFADGPVVLGPTAARVGQASEVTRIALSGLRAAHAWPAAPRPVSSEALLPERVLAGDPVAREELLDSVYRPLVKSGDVLLETLRAFLAAGGALEATARALFVHTNTVRYRLRRVAEECGLSPTDPRDAFCLRLALVVGALDEA